MNKILRNKFNQGGKDLYVETDESLMKETEEDTNELNYKIVSPLDCREIQPVHPKGDQSWVFTRRTF